MTRAFQPLVPAQPSFTDAGIAYSDRYNDLYHSASGALEQAQYVFLQGNDLPERWRGRDQFTILETGFGLGHNFLATWKAWLEDEQSSQRLHFVSFEAHPFSAADLAIMLKDTSTVLPKLVEQLLAQWPLLLPGIHRLEFEDAHLTLTLFFGDIAQTSRRMQCQADAFYLDGFSPRVNPAMWSRTLFGQLVRMAAPNATAATWCSASQIRQDLQHAGFIVQRHPGFAFKRHMTRAKLRPHLGYAHEAKPTKPILIIGGGIAGAATAYALAQHGISSQIYDPVFAQDLGGAHLGHAAVAMTPIITIDDAPRARLSRAGILRAWQRWQPFVGSSIQRCGAFLPSFSLEEARTKQETLQQLGFDLNWVQYRDAQAASQLAQTDFPFGALHFPSAAFVQPQQLLRQLLRHALITPIAQTVTEIRPHADGWELITDQNQHVIGQQVIMANAVGALPLLNPLLEQPAPSMQQMDVLGGQSNVISTHALKYRPTGVIARQGYVIPFSHTQCVVGSTYSAPNQGVSAAAHNEIMAKVAQLVPLEQAQPFALMSWFGVRAVLKDHLPVVCQAKKGLWINAGYGSYGFSWAALAADIIKAHLLAEPHVIERDLLYALYLR